MNNKVKEYEIEIDSNIMLKWQSIVDIIAELFNVPAALVMRLRNDDIEVFIASSNKDNPNSAGDKYHFINSGFYCETVIKTNNRLEVPNALNDINWKDCPAAKLGMISYLGFPMIIPNGKPFGTICVEDNRERTYSETYVKLLENFRDIVQSELDLIYMNSVLGLENKELTDYIDEIQTLRGLIPLCSKCKSVKNSEGYWERVEDYLETNINLTIEHEFCDDCANELAQLDDYIQKHQISGRELEVLLLVLKGMTNGEIGTHLNISTLTARDHVSNILKKLGFRNRKELISQFSHKKSSLNSLQKPNKISNPNKT